MFGIGGFEFFIILVFAFLIFGPDNLPEIAKKAGNAIGRFKNAKDQMDVAVRQDIEEVKEAAAHETEVEEPFKGSIETLARVTKDTAKSVQQDSFAARKAAHEGERAAREAAAAEEAAAREAAAAAAETAAVEAAEAAAAVEAAVAAETAAAEALEALEPETAAPEPAPATAKAGE